MGGYEREEELFREEDLVFSYTDEEAVDDGVLIPFMARGRDTGHRITANLYHDLKVYHQPKYPEYPDYEFYNFFLNELLPLAPYAVQEWEKSGLLQSNYDFKVGQPKGEQVIWYVPNGRGVTMMRPEDY